jgi:hypothetical protein
VRDAKKREDVRGAKKRKKDVGVRDAKNRG